jgi:hypothetical protein
MSPQPEPEYFRVLRTEFTTVADKWKGVSEAVVTVLGYAVTAWLWLTGAATWQVVTVGSLTTVIMFGFMYQAGESAWKKEHATRLAVQSELDRLRDELSRPFKIKIETNGYFIVAEEEKPPWWLVCYGVIITNQTEKPIPIEMALFTGSVEGNAKYGEECRLSIPEWMKGKGPLEGVGPLSVLSVPALENVTGFCATRFSDEVFLMTSTKDAKELVEGRPFWLEARNTSTNESQFHALNFLARNIDRGLPGLNQK